MSHCAGNKLRSWASLLQEKAMNTAVQHAQEKIISRDRSEWRIFLLLFNTCNSWKNSCLVWMFQNYWRSNICFWVQDEKVAKPSTNLSRISQIQMIPLLFYQNIAVILGKQQRRHVVTAPSNNQGCFKYIQHAALKPWNTSRASEKYYVASSAEPLLLLLPFARNRQGHPWIGKATDCLTASTASPSI